MMLYTIMYTIK